MQATDWFQYAFSAVVVFATLGAVLWVLVRRKNAFAPKAQGRKIQLVETMPLSLKHKLMLVQVDNQMVLLSVNPQDIQHLARLAAPGRHGAQRHHPHCTRHRFSVGDAVQTVRAPCAKTP